jgi:hypothetical protein
LDLAIQSVKPISTRRRMVIAAVCQPLAAKPDSRVSLGRLIIEVEGLRIELTGKRFDLLLIDDVGSAR